MTREEILAALRAQIEQERRHGIGYWCDPDLAQALREIARGGDGHPPRGVKAAAISRPPAAVASSPEGARPSPPVPAAPVSPTAQRYARPPARLNPNAPAVPSRTAAGSRTAAPRPTWGAPPPATGREADWAVKLAALDAEAKQCRLCGLCEGRNSVVFGTGKATVPLVFVGEAPGAEEDRQGIPFVGRAGELLTRIVAAIGLTREQVYICNVLKCRPPGNRDPHPDEVATCAPYLERQLVLLKPIVICTLGRHSTMLLTGENAAMKSVRGCVFNYRGVKAIPTYHPAALLRNPALKALVWEDVQKVRALLDAS